jgi:hypothetical protein
LFRRGGCDAFVAIFFVLIYFVILGQDDHGPQLWGTGLRIEKLPSLLCQPCS